METSIVTDISPPITYLVKIRCWPIKLQDSLKCNISRKKLIMKFIFGMQKNIKIFYRLILSFWVCLTRHAQSIQNKKFAYISNISRKTGRMKLIFCLQINIKDFFKLILSFEVSVDRHNRITWNNKFSICNILRKKWVMKLIFPYR